VTGRTAWPGDRRTANPLFSLASFAAQGEGKVKPGRLNADRVYKEMTRGRICRARNTVFVLMRHSRASRSGTPDLPGAQKSVASPFTSQSP
jgi:hypothetical protein